MITKTSEASFRTEIAQYQEELDLSVINDQAKTKGNRTNKFNETQYSKIKELIPSFSSKYENVLAIEEDKLVYKGNDKTLYKMALEIGLISEDELLDDEILEELQPFITEWTVDAGDSITLPIGGTCNFTVDYGDGTEELKVTSATDEDRIHTFETAGTYTVTIKGQLTQFSTVNSESKEKLTKIIQFGNTGFNILTFRGSSNLKGPIPEPSKNSLKNLTSSGQMFNGCSNLNGKIPEKIFYNSNLLSDFSYVFYECQNLSGEIPEKLFYNCGSAKSFDQAFMNCTGLTGTIPENLFSNNLVATRMGNVFRGCTNLSGRIPENLLVNHTEVLVINGLFMNCTGLTDTIPENLFRDCIKVTNANETFSGCTGLTGTIPVNLFKNNTAINSFYGTFHGCNKITGNAPALWDRDNVTNSQVCFRGCTNLSNYNDIPSTWK